MKQSVLTDEIRYKVLKALELNPHLSQRQLASVIGVSVGKANYCIKALIDVGWVKAGNFAKSQNKIGYAYFLTPTGFKEKADVTLRFLQSKQKQYESLEKEIAELKREAGAS